ncbi:uncharacterized protein VTP21DRAFT_5201 [Calcarisporiella thermophila]|uniref:uncharacterized protein n=1 Tax=Calcarisporiella thermophila TaxID=911321 RepID=UPI003741F9FA
MKRNNDSVEHSGGFICAETQSISSRLCGIELRFTGSTPLALALIFLSLPLLAMTVINSFAVALSDDYGEAPVFYPLQLIQGVVTLDIPKELRARGLKISFYGYEHAFMLQNNLASYGMKKGTLFRVQTYPWGTAIPTSPLEDWGTLAPGKHEFPFALQLPNVNYPPPFEHRYYQVEYKIQATLERPGLTNIDSSLCNVTIFPLIPTPSWLNSPVVMKRGLPGFSVEASLPRMAYLPGDLLPICLTFTEKPRTPPTKIKACLMRHLQINGQSTNFVSREEAILRQVDVVGGAFGDPSDPITITFQLPSDATPSFGKFQHEASTPEESLVAAAADEAGEDEIITPYLAVRYSLAIELKFLGSLLSLSKKVSFNIPIAICTTQEEDANLVSSRTGNDQRPRFLRSTDEAEVLPLPAYDNSEDPPEYHQPPTYSA